MTDADKIRAAIEVVREMYGVCKPEDFILGCAACQARQAIEYLEAAMADCHEIQD